MKLTSFKVDIYPSVHGVHGNPLSINTIALQSLNLLVGKNAAGKTTVCDAIRKFTKIFTDPNQRHLGDYVIDLLDDNEDVFHYEYIAGIMSEVAKPIYDGKETFISEDLFKNNEHLIERNTERARVRSVVNNGWDNVNPPENISILLARRDRTAYPYIEKLIEWANGVYFFRFGSLHPSAYAREQDIYTAQKEFNTYLGAIDNETKTKVIAEFNTLGYEVQLIDFVKEGDQYKLIINEKEVDGKIEEDIISQGMFRSLWLLLYINFLIEKRNPSLIIIDDLCEGLDFSRAKALGKLLFKKMKESKVQFLASSNDSFLMNVVDIENWNILSRENGKIISSNYFNSKEQFDKFNRIGLNNFDLFTSNFLEIGK